MNRRGFLSLFAPAAAAAIVDPAELLWKPGTKAFSFPTPKPAPTFESGIAILKAYQRELNRELTEIAEQLCIDESFLSGGRWTSGQAIQARARALNSPLFSSLARDLSTDREHPATDRDPLR